MPTAKVPEEPVGLYHSPINIRIELSAFGVILAALLFAALYSRRLDLLAPILVTVLASVARYRYFLRYGSRGRPIVSLVASDLFLDRPNDTRGGIRIPIQDLKRVIIYGPSRARTYRLLRIDGTFCEVKPQWRVAVHRQVASFLTDALPGKVIVEAPQTMFAAIRSDGPETDA